MSGEPGKFERVDDIEMEDFDTESEDDSDSASVRRFSESPEERNERERARLVIREIDSDIDTRIASRAADQALDRAGSDVRSRLASDASSENLSARNDEISNTDPHKVWYQRWKFWGFVIVSVVGVGALVVSVIDLYHSIKSENDAADSDKEKKAIDDLVRNWNSLPEPQFWRGMRDYVAKWTPNVNSQIEFMTQIMLLAARATAAAPAAMGIDAKKSAAATLFQLFDPSVKNYSALYEWLAAQNYRRTDAASVAMLALADIGGAFKMRESA